MSKRKPELSRKFLLEDAKLVTTGPLHKIANGEWKADVMREERDWYRGYVDAWRDLQLDINAGVYDKEK